MLTIREFQNLTMLCIGALSGQLEEWPLIVKALSKAGCWYNPTQSVRDYQEVGRIILKSLGKRNETIHSS